MKTYEGFLDFFKKKDKIPQEVTNFCEHIIKVANELFNNRFFYDKTNANAPKAIPKIISSELNTYRFKIFYERTFDETLLDDNEIVELLLIPSNNTVIGKDNFITFVFNKRFSKELPSKYSDFRNFIENIIKENSFHYKTWKVTEFMYWITIDEIDNVIKEISVENYNNFIAQQKYNL